MMHTTHSKRVRRARAGAAWKTAVIGIVMATLVGGAVYGMYLRPRQQLADELDAARERVVDFETALKDHGAIKNTLRELSQRMLGRSADLVDARFRSSLNDLADGAGLTSIRISTREPKVGNNPVGRASLRSDLDTQLRKQIDFYIVEGDLVANGSLEQVLRAVASIQAQAWAHRITSLGLRPMSDKDREHFELRMNVATIFAPDLVAKDAPPPARVMEDPQSTTWGPIASRNIFKAVKVEEPPPVPPEVKPPEAAVAVTPPPLPPPTVDPLEQWKLTAVVRSGERQEAWLVNAKSGERRTLFAGATVESATFVEGSGEQAVFVIEGQKFEVTTGSSLGQRRVRQ